MVTVRALLVLLLSGCALASCGGDDASDERSGARVETPAPLEAVQVYLDLEREAAGPPDAGTEGGHRGGGAKAVVRSARFQFTGTAQPSEARVAIEGADAEVDHRTDGVFIVTVGGLRRGANELTLRATAPGAKPWSGRVAITRR